MLNYFDALFNEEEVEESTTEEEVSTETDPATEEEVEESTTEERSVKSR